MSATSQTITWIPAHIAAAAIIDLLGTNINLAHIAHSNPTFVTAIMNTMGTRLALPLVRRSEWLARLEASIPVTRTKEEAKKNPTVRLLTVMRGMMFEITMKSEGERQGLDAFNMPRVAVENTKEASKAMREAKPLNEEDALRWIESWQEVGFLEKVPVKGLVSRL